MVLRAFAVTQNISNAHSLHHSLPKQLSSTNLELLPKKAAFSFPRGRLLISSKQNKQTPSPFHVFGRVSAKPTRPSTNPRYSPFRLFGKTVCSNYHKIELKWENTQTVVEPHKGHKPQTSAQLTARKNAQMFSAEARKPQESFFFSAARRCRSETCECLFDRMSAASFT